MEIELKQLKEIIDVLFKYVIETRGIIKVELDANYYWDMAEEALYNPAQEPRNLDIGSLDDDWEFISSLLLQNKEPVAFQFTEVAPILRRIGEVLARQLAQDGG